VDEVRDDLLAGARLAGDEDGRVGFRHSRRFGQHLAPCGRRTDNPPVHPAAHLVHERSRAAVDVISACALWIGGRPALRAPSMRQGEREMADDAVREREMAAIVRVRLLRPERDARAPIADLDGDAQQRPIAAGLDPLPDVPQADHPEHLVGEIANHEFSFDRRAGRLERHVAEVFVRRRLELDREVLVLGGHREGVMRKHPFHNLRYLCEHAADVRHVRNRVEQFVRPFEVRVQRSRVARERFCSGEHGVSSLVCAL
jgi:hypothetical protein